MFVLRKQSLICLAAAATLFLLGPALACAQDDDLPLVDDTRPRIAGADIGVSNDIVFGTGGGEKLLLDLAAPKGLQAPTPAIVWIHGGAWQAGSKAEFVSLIRDSAQRGYVAVTINYRLAPKHAFPAQIEDCKCAVRWLRANAERLHIDPDRIGVVGSSAGAHLAMLLGAMDKADGLEGSGGSPDVSSRVQAVVSYAGPTNLLREYPDVSKALVAAFLGGPVSDKQDLARQASPVTYVNSGDPPMLLIHGLKDTIVPAAQAIEMSEALSLAGVQGRADLMFTAGHGWPTENARVTRATFEFLGRVLKQKPATAKP